MSARSAFIASLFVLLGLLAPSGNASAACPNEALRTGPSAELPDCRAYELVTPQDLNGRLVEALNNFSLGLRYDMFPTELASPTSNSFVYSTYSSPLLAPSEANGLFDVYQAKRESTGWRTIRRLTPSGAQTTYPYLGGVSRDGLYTFIHAIAQSPAVPAGSLAGEVGTTYLSNPNGTFEPVGLGTEGVEPLAQGRYISEGGAHIIFSTGHQNAQSKWCSSAGSDCLVRKLEPNAPPTGTGAIYDRSADGPTRVISLLPGDVPLTDGQEPFYKGAAKDASSVAFTVNGVLYVRVHNGEPTDEETLEASAGGPVYGGLSADGRYLFYVVGGESGDIHRFDTETEVDDQINDTGDGLIVNVSADGSHVYFISKSQIGGEGVVGQPNLFVWSAGSTRYITTVAPSDLERTSGELEHVPSLTNWTARVVAPPGAEEVGPGAESSRTTPGGSVLVFESRARLTSYDNAGHTEIYRYDDGDESLVCVSCNSGAEPATADARLQELVLVDAPIVIHNLSADGSRVFFETEEALVDRDVDGINDVYQWHREGSATTVDLISSGNSKEYPLPSDVSAPYIPRSNILLSVTPTGKDVMFLTQDALVPGAPEAGTTSIYDARVEGGFPVPAKPVSCLEEGCRGPTAASSPSLVSPRSASIEGRGNVKPRKRHKARRHCRRRAKPKRCQKHKRQRSSSARASAASLSQLQPESLDGQSSSQAPSEGVGGEATFAATAASVAGEFDEFGIKSVGASVTSTMAGGHPDFTTTFELNHHFLSGRAEADGRPENISISLPPGLLGNPNAVPRCRVGELVAFSCPFESQVGVTRVLVGQPPSGEFLEPVYNVAPPHPDREVARLGFVAAIFPVFIDIQVRTADDYGVTARVHDSPSLAPLIKATTTLWGNPADPSHDEYRLTPGEVSRCENIATCKPPGGGRASGLSEPFKAFMTNPSACQSGSIGFQVSSYQLPGQIFTASAPFPAITDCQGLPFEPSLSVEPTSHVAGAPTGLKTKLMLPQHLGVAQRATATMREARVTLPEGMQIAAGAANWIGTCSEDQVGFRQEVAAACPDAAKLGSARIVSPSLSAPIEGALYQRTPTPGHPFGLWLVSDALGLHIKLPGELEPDKQSGRLTAVFRGLPQVPVEEIELNVWGGERAPLQNPDSCGTFATDFSFAPHSNDPIVTGQSQMRIDQGCEQGFDPKLDAGATIPVAGAFSPFVFDLTRADGQQALRGFELHLPEGELAKLRGVPLCPDQAATAGGCPGASAIGHLLAVSGPGPDPLVLPQPGKAEPRIFLAGPYQGAPFSIVTEVPAQAGPFDLGVVVVRSGLAVDPETARATVKADPLPQFFEGVGISYRRLHAVIDRPNFSLNPTDCRPMAVTSKITSTKGAIAKPSSRFQVDGCRALKFKPKLSLKLKGGASRGDYPALTATVKARKGDANIGKVSVALPHSEFLAQEHIVTICTRKRFAADNCPKGSIYGKATARSPLLAKPLSGPVYLRSSDNPLPDLVVALSGELDIHLVGRIDSKNGGIRTTFASVPDAPVTKFVMRMRGGVKGLLVNSQNICRGDHRATVNLRAQNGRAATLRPLLEAASCKAGKHQRKAHKATIDNTREG